MANTTTEPATLNDLPAEMVCEVLRRLSLEDLVSLKLTGKRYLEIVTDFRVKKLKVGVHEMSNSIEHCQPNLFVLQFVQPTLSHLQQLTIDVRLKCFDLNELNRFTRLVQLKIGSELSEGGQIRLDLPDLRQLEVACNRTREMRINSTKLEKLTYYGDGNLLQVEHPETVVTLNSDLQGELLSSFRNVRHLRSSSNLRILDERTLSDFPDLKELAYTGTLDEVWDAFEDGDQGWQNIEDLSPYLERFMAKKRALGRADLKVQFVSFELVDHKPIVDYKFRLYFSDYNDRTPGSFDLLSLQVHNYDQIIDTYPNPSINYDELWEEFRGRIPEDFSSKIVGIERIWSCSAYLHEEEEHLLRFLKSLPELKHLEANAEALSESFFCQLAESCSKSLKFMSLSLKRLENLRDLDFSAQFKVLDSLTLDMNLSPEEIRWLLNMSWFSKRQFDLVFRYEAPKTERWVQYGVMRRLDSEEAFLYRYESHFLGLRNYGFCQKQICLKTCPLACLGELAEYFENLQHQDINIEPHRIVPLEGENLFRMI